MRMHPIDGLLFLAMKLLKSFDKRQTDLKYFDPERIKNILIVSSTAIGDTLLSTPAIRAVRERYPDSGIIGHFNIKNMELFENNPHINGIIPYYRGYKKFFKLVKEFRRHKFDLALIFHGNEPQATPMAYLSGARFIMKLPNASEYRFLLSNRDKIFRWEDFTHGVEQRLKVAEMADCKITDKRMVLPILQQDKAFVENFLKNNGLNNEAAVIGLQASASTISRMWFADRFIELGKKLINSYPDLKIVITGSTQERDYCKKIADGIGDKAIVSAGLIPLKYMPSLIKKLKALITGDTGIMHMAIAAGTLVVALYAVSDAKRSGPYYDMNKHIVIRKDRTCNPCSSKKCRYQKCMEQISVDEVFEAVRKVIGAQNTAKKAGKEQKLIST